MASQGSFPGELIDKRDQKLKSQMIKFGYQQPSKDILDMIQKLDSMTGILNTIEDISNIYQTQKESPEILLLVNQIAAAIILQKVVEVDLFLE